jgi:hypothetical protein
MRFMTSLTGTYCLEKYGIDIETYNTTTRIGLDNLKGIYLIFSWQKKVEEAFLIHTAIWQRDFS